MFPVNVHDCTMTIWKATLQNSDTPRYLAIADAIARDVARGALVPGTRLPTHRQLAQQLGVTVGTVTRGYEEAERRGLTVGEVGRGTFVRGREEPERHGWKSAPRHSSGVIDLSLATPWVPPDGEDGRVLGATLQRLAADTDLSDLLVYDVDTASARQCAAAAAWIGRLGHTVAPGQIIATAGAQHAITAILSALLRPGDTLLVEELTYPALKAVAQLLGLRLRAVALDEEGVQPEDLERACVETGAQLLYCLATIQNPTCRSMSLARREAIAAVARKHGLTVIEDAVHVPLAEDTTPPIAQLAPERTVYVATLSKWATFGLRVGFVAAPEPLVERVRAAVRTTLWMAAPLMVEIAARWLVDGTGERLAARKREELRERHVLVQEILGAHYRVETQPRSLHFWLYLPEPWRSDELVMQARQRGILVAGAEAFAVGRGEVPHAVRVAIAAPAEREDLRRALTTLHDILSGGAQSCVNIL